MMCYVIQYLRKDLRWRIQLTNINVDGMKCCSHGNIEEERNANELW